MWRRRRTTSPTGLFPRNSQSLDCWISATPSASAARSFSFPCPVCLFMSRGMDMDLPTVYHHFSRIFPLSRSQASDSVHEAGSPFTVKQMKGHIPSHFHKGPLQYGDPEAPRAVRLWPNISSGLTLLLWGVTSHILDTAAFSESRDQPYHIAQRVQMYNIAQTRLACRACGAADGTACLAPRPPSWALVPSSVNGGS